MRLAGRADPIWRKAPLLLLRWPSLLLALAAALLVLALATASAPLVLASAANAAFEREVATYSAEQLGVGVGIHGRLERDLAQTADAHVRGAARATVPELGEGRLTVLTAQARLTGVAGGEEIAVQPLARDGALDHLDVVEGDRRADGVWVARSAAQRLRVGAGDRVVLLRGDATRVLPVAGVYADLAERLPVLGWNPPDPLPRDDPAARFWSPLSSRIVRLTPQGPRVGPTFLVADLPFLLHFGAAAGGAADYGWDFPLDAGALTFERAREVAQRYARFEAQVRDRSRPAGNALADLRVYSTPPRFVTFLPGSVARVNDTMRALTGPVEALARAGQVAALAVVAASAAFRVQRRRHEIRLLGIQGVSPLRQGVHAASESVLPAVLGVTAGWGLALALVRGFGPSPLVSSRAALQAGAAAALAAAVALGAIAAATALKARADSSAARARPGAVAARVPWDLLLLVLAAVAYYELRTTAADEAQSRFVLLFPLLLLAGLAFAATRVLGKVLPAVRVPRDAPPAAYLAASRLAAAPGLALVLVGVTTLAVGVLAYAATTGASTSRTIEAHAKALAGADVAVELPAAYRDVGATFPTTIVLTTEGELSPSGTRVDVYGIDRATFTDAAQWDPSFAELPRDELLAALDAAPLGALPVIVVGADTPARGTLVTSRYDVPFVAVARAAAFPAHAGGGALVVTDAEKLLAVADAAGGSIDERLLLRRLLLARGDPHEISTFLEASGVSGDRITTAASVRTRPALLARTWTLGYLQAVGVVAGMLALAGLVLYLQARQQGREVAFVLLRRMGLSARAHRLAVTAELLGLLALSTALGALFGLVAARLVNPLFDPLPGAAPGPLFAVPLALVAALLVALELASLAGAALVHRQARRARVTEVLRVAE